MEEEVTLTPKGSEYLDKIRYGEKPGPGSLPQDDFDVYYILADLFSGPRSTQWFFQSGWNTERARKALRTAFEEGFIEKVE